MASPTPLNVTSTTPGSGASAAPTTPGTPQANDIIVVGLYKENTAAVTKPAGFTEEANVNNVNHNHYLFWKRCSGGESGAMTFSWTGSVWRESYAVLIRGCVTTGDPFDPAGIAHNETNAANPSTSLTTTAADTLLIASDTNFDGGSYTPPAGFTEQFDGGGDISFSTLAQAAAGSTGTLTYACSAAGGRETMLLGALLPAASASAGMVIARRNRIRTLLRM